MTAPRRRCATVLRARSAEKSGRPDRVAEEIRTPPRSRPVSKENQASKASKARAFALAALLGLCLAPAALAASEPSATPPIERVWSFNGGEVAIQSQPGGRFLGTVVVPTKFAACTHPVGESMWTAIQAQPDGSYWGFHQWYFETAPCTAEPELGPTAWRVMKTASGASYLLVCFGTPGGAQPTIATDGSTASVGYGCVRSAEVAPVAAVESFASAVSLPSSHRCLSRRSFQLHLHQQRYDPFKEVLVRLGRRRLRVQRHGNVFAARIDLRGLPRGAFTVHIRLTTVLGHRIAGSRTFHTCAVKHSRPSAAKAGR